MPEHAPEDQLTPRQALDRIETHSHELAQVGRAMLAVSDLALSPGHVKGRLMLDVVERDDLAALLQVFSDAIRRATREVDKTISLTSSHRAATRQAAG